MRPEREEAWMICEPADLDQYSQRSVPGARPRSRL
jgi:hypothetical protein